VLRSPQEDEFYFDRFLFTHKLLLEIRSLCSMQVKKEPTKPLKLCLGGKSGRR
jgi:hypothetical protein